MPHAPGVRITTSIKYPKIPSADTVHEGHSDRVFRAMRQVRGPQITYPSTSSKDVVQGNDWTTPAATGQKKQMASIKKSYSQGSDSSGHEMLDLNQMRNNIRRDVESRLRGNVGHDSQEQTRTRQPKSVRFSTSPLYIEPAQTVPIKKKRRQEKNACAVKLSWWNRMLYVLGIITFVLCFSVLLSALIHKAIGNGELDRVVDDPGQYIISDYKNLQLATLAVVSVLVFFWEFKRT